jgi:hypothetical protein
MAYDNNGGNRPPARDKNVLDDPRLTLSAPTPGVDKAWAKMNWGFFGNNGHLVVWTNDPEDQTEKNANGKIGVKIPAQDYEKFLSLIDLAIDLPPGEKNGMDVIDYSYYGRERSEKPEVQATIWVGKNKEGEVWLSLISKDNSRPKIQFKFGKTMYHAFKHGDGQPFSDAETSVLAARAHLRTIRRALDHLFPTTYVHKEKNADGNKGGNRGGGGGGSYNRGGGGGGNNRSGGGYGDRRGGNSEPTFADESGDGDIPF